MRWSSSGISIHYWIVVRPARAPSLFSGAISWHDRYAIMQAGDMFWGARYGQVQDPFGHAWSLSHPIAPPAGATRCGP